MTSRAALAALALLVLAAYAAVAAGAVRDPELATWATLAGLLLLPGLAGAYLWGRGRRGVTWEILANAAGLGIAVHALTAWLLHGSGRSFDALAWAPALAGAGLAALCIGMDDRPALAGPETKRRRAASVAPVLLALLVAGAVSAGWPGPPPSVHSDGPAHAAMVRRAAMTGESFREDAFYRDAGHLGSDPRTGLFHSLLAVAVRVSDQEPFTVWRWAPAVLAPLLLLSVYTLARAVTGRRGPALCAAAASLLFLGGTRPLLPWREAVYPSVLAEALVLLVLASGFRYLRGGAVRDAWLATALAFGAVATHVFAGVALAVAAAATLVAMALDALSRRRELAAAPGARTFGRVLLLGALVALATAPYLAWRYATAYAPADPIHLEPQGLLDWGGPRLVSVLPSSVWQRLGWAALALPFAALWLWGERRRGPAYGYLTIVSLGIPLAVLHPMVLPFLHDYLGYLSLRLVACVPVAVVLGLAAWWAAAAWRRGERRGATWMLAVLLLAAGAQAAALFETGRRGPSAEETRELGWLDHLQSRLVALRAGATGPFVVAADPAVSYFVPGATGHFVTTVMPQHGSPNDSLGEARLTRARDWFLPRVPAARAAALLRQAGAELLIVPTYAGGPRVGGLWIQNPAYLAARLDTLAARPDLFRLGPAAEGFAMVLPAETGWVRGAEPGGEPAVMRPSTADRSAAVAAAVHEWTRLGRAVVAPGESLAVETAWRRVRPLPPGEYRVEGSLLNRAPGDAWHRPWYGKLHRKLRHALTRERRYAESFHAPADGLWPPETWPESTLVHERYPFPLPSDLLPGVYDLRLRFRRVAHHPNQRLADWHREDERTWGLPVATVEVRAIAPDAAP